jgi:hypothetical protein
MGGNNKLDNSPSVIERVGQNAASNFEGILSLKPIAKYLSGARCTLRINGKIVGFAFGITWNITTEVTEVNTIDDYLPYELAPSRITVNGTISNFRVPGSGPGISLIQTDVLNFLHQRYVEIEVKDSQTDNLIFLTRKALITSRNESIKSDSLATMTLNFKAIGYADERIPKKAQDVEGELDVNGTNPLNRLTNKLGL